MFLTLGGPRRLGLDDLLFFLPSYLVFAAPQLVWAILTWVLRVGGTTAHASALGWLLYWPFAAILMVVGGGLVAAWKTWQAYQP